MKLKVISYILQSMSIGIDIGLLVGIVYLSNFATQKSVSKDSLVLILVLGVFLLGVGWLLFLLALQIDVHSDAEEVKQW